MLELFADWHTHSFYSDGHATPEEIAAAAARRGLDEVAITDHGPRGMLIGVKNAGVYLEIKRQAERLSKRYGIRVLVGAEANVTGPDGGLDLPGDVVGQLDILIAGLHPQVWCKPLYRTLTWILPNQAGRYIGLIHGAMRKTNTRALVAAVRKNRPTFISHPNLMMAVDLDEVARVCAATGCAMEINMGHSYDREAVLQAALAHGALLVVNSDSHFPETVGELDEGIALLEKYGVLRQQVLNARRGANPLEKKEATRNRVGQAGIAAPVGSKILH